MYEKLARPGQLRRRAILLVHIFLHIKGGSHLTGILITGYYNHNNTQRAFTVIPRTVRHIGLLRSIPKVRGDNNIS